MTTADNDPWLSLQDGPDGDAVFIRALRTPPSDSDRAHFPVLIVAAWPYEHDGAGGLPDKKTYDQMHRFQEAVFAALVESGVGMEAASLLGRGVKEWRYYAADAERFLEVFNQALDALPAFPIEMQSYDDPDWDGLTELLP
ncbi:hypothetical protein QO010_000721 [Caulobacter ginsengisoli]|uniref:DUF695 domain-containing protein n=1 Tax=Caulobacter ginsengisoli TaxID=400775 RepID=A0ABU0IP75_9CAUL|nr:DUF695 domain-containing protein [Caulobacter ginsengisoli]MDQ0462973.1 hypothetical protein [Caulobacter ginsengisoli]